jgi:hypothetical protein
MSVNVVSLACEFPNDNPSLHAGVSWICHSPTGLPQPELSVHEPPEAACGARQAAEAHAATLVAVEMPVAPRVVEPEVVEVAADEIVVEELEPVEVLVEGVVPVFESVAPPSFSDDSSALPPPSDDPFTTLVCALADVAIGAGAPHVAAMLPALMFDARVPEHMNVVAGIYDGDGIDPEFARTTAAWRAILRGTSDDFSDCGMLDEWASDVLARLLEGQEAAPKLKKELRSRGVAAFGLS